MKPLAGIRVIDFSTLLPGPLATLMLSDAGAEVIKVEKIGGEDMRKSIPKINGESFLFAILNRGKKSIEIDLKKKDGYQRIKKLIKSCDVIVEQFRPGVMKRLGLHWSAVKKINKKVVYCSISGYGQIGKKSLRAGHDLNYMAESGLLCLSTSNNGAPTIPSTQVADIAGGTYPAFMNILLGIIKASKSGRGSYIDISMFENLIPLAWLGLGGYLYSGNSPKKNTLHLNGGIARYNIYKTKDKKYLALGALEDKFWQNFCEIIGAPAEVKNEEFNSDILINKIQNIVKKKSSLYWKKKFENQYNICCTPVGNISEFFNDEHIQKKELFKNIIEIGKKNYPLIPTAVSKDLSRIKKKSKAPKLGQHNYLIK